MYKLFHTKRGIWLFVIGILLFAAVVFGVTYAYFLPLVQGDAETPVDVTGEALDNMTFDEGDAINIVMTQENFGKNDGNLTDTSYPTATLYPSGGSASDQYYLFLAIEYNDYIYTTGDAETPELILTITKPDGTELTQIDGLTHVTSGGVSGFDVTTKTGIFTVAQEYAIESGSDAEIVQRWEATLSLINLDTDQNDNSEKTFTAKIIMQAEDTMSVGPICYGEPMAQCMTTYSSLVPTLIKHTPELANGAADNNYRFSGSNEVVNNNYVCFGFYGTPCPANNLYRIIGIYDMEGEYKVKLIKNASVGNRYWDVESSIWEGANTSSESISDDADINQYLNTSFYNGFSENYRNMISSEKYFVGLLYSPQDYVARVLYNNEISAKTINEYNIGLMYASDYAFGTLKSYWNTDGYDYGIDVVKNNNWLYFGITEWTIISQNTSRHVVYIMSGGYISTPAVNNYIASRPVFYLDPSVMITDGIGTASDPFLLEMPTVPEGEVTP